MKKLLYLLSISLIGGSPSPDPCGGIVTLAGASSIIAGTATFFMQGTQCSVLGCATYVSGSKCLEVSLMGAGVGAGIGTALFCCTCAVAATEVIVMRPYEEAANTPPTVIGQSSEQPNQGEKPPLQQGMEEPNLPGTVIS